METKTTANTKKQSVKIVEGEFMPSQASKLISSLINQKISYHTQEIVQLWERDHTFDQAPINKRIKELEKELENASAFISEAENEGKRLQISGSIQINIIE